MPGDVIDFPKQSPWQDLEPFALASCEEFVASCELLATDGHLKERVRILTADDGDWVSCVPEAPALRGHILAAIRTFIALKLARSVIITTVSEGAFETWTLGSGACAGVRQPLVFTPKPMRAGDVVHLKNPADRPPLVASLSDWFCTPHRTNTPNAVNLALYNSAFGSSGIWRIFQVTPPYTPITTDEATT